MHNKNFIFMSIKLCCLLWCQSSSTTKCWKRKSVKVMVFILVVVVGGSCSVRGKQSVNKCNEDNICCEFMFSLILAITTMNAMQSGAVVVV